MTAKANCCNSSSHQLTRRKLLQVVFKGGAKRDNVVQVDEALRGD